MKDLRSQTIYIDDKERTYEIVSYSFEGNKCVLVYKSSNKAYSYCQSRVKFNKIKYIQLLKLCINEFNIHLYKN